MACTIDFRRLDEGFGGKTYKRKRQESQVSADTANLNDATAAASSMDVDDSCPPPAKRSAVPSSEDPNKPTFGQPTYDGVIAGRVSGRNWKQPRKQRASAKHVSIKRPSLEERERQKEIKRAYRERVDELKEEIRQSKLEKRKKREEREKKKKENILRSGTKFQKITNPKTLKKIAKSKQKKLLQVVPDDFLNKKSK
ncbi:INDOLE-3-ACETATE BETA-D-GLUCOSYLTRANSFERASE family protein [Hibiscus syriacus]|uniref:Coiled-coil domain-containing protein 86 n=1 Tax=Hibiscus syriacus TaxID=106335 RepID=A0A6A3B4T9_HIBSY|nr:protein PXR1-like [Hibiscus syriacus]KAE8710069.1 INDOLE-3-ACETATE BETA-D-GLUCOSYLTRANSFERASE family protein [Hibiscus syriacus]